MPPTARVLRRSAHSRTKPLLRQDILAAAREILVREGSAALSMRKLAERIDCSATAIYLHFKNRDDLVSCLCEEVIGGLARELQQVADRHRDPLVALRKSLRRYVEFGLTYPQQYHATFAVPHGRALAAVIRNQESGAMSRQALAFLPRLLGECVKRRKLATTDVHATSCALWAGVHGITSLLIAMPDFDWGDPDKVVDRLIAMLVAGLER